MALIFAFTCSIAAAESIQARVVSVDPSGQSITVETTGGDIPGESITLRVSPGTQFSGIGSFDELETGDQISVEASQGPGASGEWEVQNLSRGMEGAGSNAALSASSGSSLRDATGSASANLNASSGSNSNTAGGDLASDLNSGASTSANAGSAAGTSNATR